MTSPPDYPRLVHNPPVPWKIVKRGSQHCVVNKDTGATVHCHPTRPRAIAQLAALYANAEPGEVEGKPTDEKLVKSTRPMNGGMVCLFPDDPESIASRVDDDHAEDVSELHLTLAYVAEDVSRLDPASRQAVLRAAVLGAQTRSSPLTLTVVGYGSFGSADPPATVLFLQADTRDGVGNLAETVRSELDKYGADSFPPAHDTFVPHLTLGYGVDLDQAAQFVGETIVFSQVSVMLRDDRLDYPWGSRVDMTKAQPSSNSVHAESVPSQSTSRRCPKCYRPYGAGLSKCPHCMEPLTKSTPVVAPPNTTVYRLDPRLHSHPYVPDASNPSQCKECGMGTGVHPRMVMKDIATQPITDPLNVGYSVVKARDELRYSLGPVYKPGQYDAHGEWATAESIQKAMWEYVRDTGGDRTVYLQHTPYPAGEWVEVVTWPSSVDVVMKEAGNRSRTTTFPAGTAYMGVIWEPWAWEEVKSGGITGFSMGGMARRVEAEIVPHPS